MGRATGIYRINQKGARGACLTIPSTYFDEVGMLPALWVTPGSTGAFTVSAKKISDESAKVKVQVSGLSRYLYVTSAIRRVGIEMGDDVCVEVRGKILVVEKADEKKED